MIATENFMCYLKCITNAESNYTCIWCRGAHGICDLLPSQEP